MLADITGTSVHTLRRDQVATLCRLGLGLGLGDPCVTPGWPLGDAWVSQASIWITHLFATEIEK